MQLLICSIIFAKTFMLTPMSSAVPPQFPFIKEVENDQRNDRSQKQIKHADDQNGNQRNVQSKEPHGGPFNALFSTVTARIAATAPPIMSGTYGIGMPS